MESEGAMYATSGAVRSFCLGLVVMVGASSSAQSLISNLPLDRNLQDTVTGGQATFTRASVAWTGAG